ncbi:hypothetical protein EVAR_94623_1 [Eumeta japonica]|uniref:Uncharacterized protein n=1 Tax=Eumeta variegata TaxID=151549 RepID=A0A4C1UTH5_EUMVA|nr:hypothetical protein EVAR_94623_1 [Eumeta japonica]
MWYSYAVVNLGLAGKWAGLNGAILYSYRREVAQYPLLCFMLQKTDNALVPPLELPVSMGDGVHLLPGEAGCERSFLIAYSDRINFGRTWLIPELSPVAGDSAVVQNTAPRFSFSATASLTSNFQWIAAIEISPDKRTDRHFIDVTL